MIVNTDHDTTNNVNTITNTETNNNAKHNEIATSEEKKEEQIDSQGAQIKKTDDKELHEITAFYKKMINSYFEDNNNIGKTIKREQCCEILQELLKQTVGQYNKDFLNFTNKSPNEYKENINSVIDNIFDTAQNKADTRNNDKNYITMIKKKDFQNIIIEILSNGIYVDTKEGKEMLSSIGCILQRPNEAIKGILKLKSLLGSDENNHNKFNLQFVERQAKLNIPITTASFLQNSNGSDSTNDVINNELNIGENATLSIYPDNTASILSNGNTLCEIDLSKFDIKIDNNGEKRNVIIKNKDHSGILKVKNGQNIIQYTRNYIKIFEKQLIDNIWITENISYIFNLKTKGTNGRTEKNRPVIVNTDKYGNIRNIFARTDKKASGNLVYAKRFFDFGDWKSRDLIIKNDDRNQKIKINDKKNSYKVRLVENDENRISLKTIVNGRLEDGKDYQLSDICELPLGDNQRTKHIKDMAILTASVCGVGSISKLIAKYAKKITQLKKNISTLNKEIDRLLWVLDNDKTVRGQEWYNLRDARNLLIDEQKAKNKLLDKCITKIAACSYGDFVSALGTIYSGLVLGSDIVSTRKTNNQQKKLKKSTGMKNNENKQAFWKKHDDYTQFNGNLDNFVEKANLESFLVKEKNKREAQPEEQNQILTLRNNRNSQPQNNENLQENNQDLPSQNNEQNRNRRSSSARRRDTGALQGTESLFENSNNDININVVRPIQIRSANNHGIN